MRIVLVTLILPILAGTALADLTDLLSPAPLEYVETGMGKVYAKLDQYRLSGALITDATNRHPDLEGAYKGYVMAYMDGEKAKIKECEKMIKWVNYMGIAMFIVVHLFLLFAMAVAAMEFAQARRTRRRAAQEQAIEVSLQKVALKTSLHGTMLLLMSLVLYFLFLRFGYVVTVVK